MTKSNDANGASAPTTTPWGTGLTQNDLMEKDTVLVLDNADKIIGTASKKESHVFSNEQPHGILHRAFSVFLFDETDGRLLLQQRAASKITFPNVRSDLISLLKSAERSHLLQTVAIMSLSRSHSLSLIPSNLTLRSGPTRVAPIP
jgi:hypothetical protein